MYYLLERLQQPWPWYIGGIAIGVMVPLLLILTNEKFGISSSLRHICAATLPTKLPYFNYDWKSQSWNIVLVLGVILGSFLAHLTVPDQQVALSAETVNDLSELGITQFSGLMPAELFSWDALANPASLMLLVVGGFLVGFGTRYANGCTSGHAIMGLSMLSTSSLIAVIGFFAGGLLMTHFLLPLIL